MAGPPGEDTSGIPSETENKQDKETSKDEQPLQVQTDEEPAPLNSEEERGAAGNQDEEFEIIDYSEVALAEDYHKDAMRKEKPLKENIDKIREILESTYWTTLGYPQRYHTVGIFSRSSETDYEWLIKQLKSELFHSTVSSADHHYISNNGKQQFMDAVSGCTFGILYHTKNRGRINITDVPDSLYDEELKYMSEQLGKEKVIVVVDDLEETSEEEKTRILKCQPRIKDLARDLLLFSANEKKKITQEL